MKTLGVIYMLRVQVLFWLLLMILVPGATHINLLRGLFAFHDKWEFFWFAFTIFVYAAVLIVTTNLVLYYGRQRLFARTLTKACSPRRVQVVLVFLVCALGSLAAVIEVIQYSLGEEQGLSGEGLKAATAFSWSAVGILAALAAMLLAKMIQLLVSDPASEGPLFFLLPLHEPPQGLFAKLLAMNFPLGPIAGWSKWFREKVAAVGQGYMCRPQTAPYQPPAALRGHAFLTALAVLAAICYCLSGYKHEANLLAIVPPPDPQFPAIVHALLAVLVALFSLTGLAFFLDRYRIPLLLPILLLASGSALLKRETDHMFVLLPPTSVELPTPHDVVVNKKMNRLVVVASAGGGIQATAWTAQVMTGLDQQTGNRFRQHLAAVSSVSGGSVGLLDYLTGYEGLFGNAAKKAKDIQQMSRQDSLEPVAWALVHPDAQRAIFPLFADPAIDRGWALQRSFSKLSGVSGIKLSSMAQRLRKSWDVPALLINTTAVELGAPVVFPTTEFHGENSGIFNFWRIYAPRENPRALRDIDLATAVRLSASFPFVSPAARAQDMQVATHFLDGGYYDNFGVSTMLAWLSEALRNIKPDNDLKILFVTINAFAEDLQCLGKDKGDKRCASAEPWIYQLKAPVDALYQVRSYSQGVRDKYEQTLEFANNSRVFNKEYRYRGISRPCQEKPPLSWHLSRRECDCIDEAWKSFQDDICLKTFLDGKDDNTIRKACTP